MIGLQERLLQMAGRQHILRPARPREWDVDFKMHARGQSVVDCTHWQRCIVRLIVTPASRQKDVTVTP